MLSDLIKKCNYISYKNLEDIILCSNKINCSKMSKGYVANIIENYFCVRLKNKAECDFPDLGIELKTLSLNKKHEPNNSAFICLFFPNISSIDWKKSLLYNKTKHILWVPYYNYQENIMKYKFLKPFFYNMYYDDELIIKNDFYILLKIFYSGNFNMLNNVGNFLQLKSHANNKIDVLNVFDKNGNKKSILRLGFYFKKNFLKILLNRFS